MKLEELGEFPFLSRLRARVPVDPRVSLGIGDDCAALTLPGTTVITTDAMVENVHFRREWGSFYALGEKAFAANASDIAAMGATPTFALLSLAVPQDCEVQVLDEFFDGFLHAAKTDGAALIGGNMSAAPCFMVSVTLLGQAQHGVLKRAGARVGDDVYVTGTPGDAAVGLRMLQEGRDDAPARAAKARFLTPTARTAIGREVAAYGLATAMIDVSDGVLQDLGHLCGASHVAAAVEASLLPLSTCYREILGASDWSCALTGGEDYELLFSAAAGHRIALAELAETIGCPITRIGHIVPQSQGIRVYDPDGGEYVPVRAGYDHFHRA
ncbi:MAG: thiamine-phosphate kinase [Deltaproteobacteria bacterium]|nr:thiamine-phosphate kinase [Deltaproteobacteria bacterium]